MGFALSRLTGLTRRRVRDVPAVDDMPVLRRADAHPDAPPRRPIFAASEFGEAGMFAQPEAREAPDEREAPEECAPLMEGEAMEEPETMEEDAIPLSTEAAFEAPSPATAGDMPRAMPRIAEQVEDSRPGAVPLVPAAEDARDPAGFAPLAAPVPPPHVEEPVQAVAEPRSPAPLDGLTIAELTERFERGLARRRTAPVEAPRTAAPRVLADIPPASPVAVKPEVDLDVDQALQAALGRLRQMSGR